MTGRVCPVHEEWSATGVCRWCEKPPRMPPRMPTKLPDGSAPCRCGEYSWLPECSPDMREGVIDRMFHSPAQCFKLDATPPAEPVYLPGLKGLWQKPDRVEVNEAGVPTYTWTFEQETPEAYVFRLEWTKSASEAIAAGVNKACEARLAKEHATLRWERVARRWNYKHRGGGGTEEGRAYVWRWWLEQMDRSAAGLPLAGPFPLGFYAW